MGSPERGKSVGALRLRKGERRRQLLELARRGFASVGYAGYTLDKLAQDAEVSPAIVARHFEEKATLFEAVLAEIREATLFAWVKIAGAINEPLAKLHAIAEAYCQSLALREGDVKLLQRAVLEIDDETVGPGVRGLFLECESLIAGIIADGQQSGVFSRPLDPRIGAWQLIHAGVGFGLAAQLGVPLFRESDYGSRAIECALQCLLKTDV